MALEQLTYTSTAVKDFGELELSRLLLQARRNNERSTITGLLLYHERSFLQVLEGEGGVIDTVFARIERDERHTRVSVLVRQPVPARQFADWAMGFVAAKRIADTLPGFSDFLQHRGDPTRARGLATSILAKFRDGEYRAVVER
ncbi:MAG TPA: BLUF domain-containing protein [Polyangiaceae bacterium]|nr:BLUF domain-containing protein [Polyangiaceae bacterium]